MGIKLPDPLPTAESETENATQEKSSPVPNNDQITSERELERESFLDRLTRQILEISANRQSHRQTENPFRDMIHEIDESANFEGRLDWYRRRHRQDFQGTDTLMTGEREARRQLPTERPTTPTLPADWLPHENRQLFSEPYRPLNNRTRWDMLISPADFDRCLWRPRDTLTFRDDGSAVETRENDTGAPRPRQHRVTHASHVLHRSNETASEHLNSEGETLSGEEDE